MKNITGWIRHAAATTFTSVYFSVPTLAVGAEKQIATKIKANVVADTNDLWWFDKIAFIDASGEADLSKMRFQDSDILVDVIFPG